MTTPRHIPAASLALTIVATAWVSQCVGCRNPSQDDAPAGAMTMPLIVAHRGASGDAPENTLAAFMLAFEQGADAIEGDFWLTADGGIVAHHNRSLKKTAGIDREIESMTMSELSQTSLRKLDRAEHGGMAAQHVPTMEQVLATVQPSRGTIFIELKSDARIVPALAATLQRCDVPPSRATIISFDADSIAAVREQLPEHRALWLVDFERKNIIGGWKPDISEVIDTARRIDAHGVDLNANLDVLTPEAMKQLRDAGLEVHVWTVNDARTARRLMRLGVDSITTDRPGALRREPR